MDKHIDEHDPSFDPDLSDPLPEGILGFLKSTATAAIMGVGAALVAAFLVGCDGEYDRQLRAAELRAKFFNACLPRKGDTVNVYWSKGELICQRYQPSNRYGKTFPHAEVRVANLEEME